MTTGFVSHRSLRGEDNGDGGSGEREDDGDGALQGRGEKRMVCRFVDPKNRVCVVSRPQG